jgi:ABC-type bacteriocin/lantibiotic exporter with double-glycine peptidase domain
VPANDSAVVRQKLHAANAARAVPHYPHRCVDAWHQRCCRKYRLPLIAHWNQEHFVVVYRIAKGKVYVSDPAGGKVVYTRDEFLKCWATTVRDDEPQGVCLLLEPTPDFYAMDGEKADRSGFAFLFNYLRPHKKFIVQLVLGLLTGTLLQLLFPFLTQAVVDVGIATRNISFIYLVLLEQMILFISRMSVEFIHSWIPAACRHTHPYIALQRLLEKADESAHPLFRQYQFNIYYSFNKNHYVLYKHIAHITLYIVSHCSTKIKKKYF